MSVSHAPRAGGLSFSQRMGKIKRFLKVEDNPVKVAQQIILASVLLFFALGAIRVFGKNSRVVEQVWEFAKFECTFLTAFSIGYLAGRLK